MTLELQRRLLDLGFWWTDLTETVSNVYFGNGDIAIIGSDVEIEAWLHRRFRRKSP
ncbi:hypothetical protein LCGC14_1791570 [marine sediment metagenome]|uniref:Uncharacterized protein n=1 Tax=marine sediment metagenome TaxID=412755 RepID=A0A0F9GSE3_9ZZZZ